MKLEDVIERLEELADELEVNGEYVGVGLVLCLADERRRELALFPEVNA